MDPITVAIVAAITAGATSGATKVTEAAITDAYNALKTVIKNKFGKESNILEAINHLEKKPNSNSRQEGVKEEVESTKAYDDPELKHLAEVLTDALHKIPEGNQALTKFKVIARDSQIGVIGDQTKVEGGIHFTTRPHSE